MLTSSEVSGVADEIARFIETKAIRFERGSPRQYFSQLGFLSLGFTLPIVPREQLATVVLLKNYCNLWNILVDDEIDREGRRGQLDASIQLLVGHSSRGARGSALDSSAAMALDEVLTRLPSDPSRAYLREAFYFDLWDEVNGFNYEYCINKAVGAANSVEYGKYSTMTASLKHFLDLDCLFAADPLPPTTYRQLRSGYEHLGVAIKFASDLGTLKRELMEEDNLNIIRILGLESGLSGVERKLESEAQYDALLPSLAPIFDKARQLATTHLETARALLSQVPGVDTGALVKSVSALVETYSKRDPFFRK